MNGRKTLLLLGVLALLCLGYWGMLRAEKAAHRKEVIGKLLFDFAGTDIDRLTVARAGETPVTAEQKDKSWAIVEPHPIAAEQGRWNRMATVLAALINERTVADASDDLAAFGLDEPPLVVTADAKGKKTVVSFGRATPTQDYRYARVGDGPVFLTPDGAYNELNAALLELRDRSMVRGGPGSIEKIEYSYILPSSSEAQYEPVKVVVERRDDARWHVVAPVQGAADQETVGNLVASLEQMPGRDYVDEPEDLSDYRLDPPRVKITAWTRGNPEPQTIYFGGIANTDEEEKGLYVKRADSPAVFTVNASLLQFFPERPDSFRDRRLFTHAAVDLRRIHYRSPNADVVLEHSSDKGWQMVQPPVEEVDQQAVSNFIAALKEVRGDEFIAQAPVDTGLDAPSLQMDMTLEGGKTISLAAGGPTPDGEQVFARQDTGSLMLMNPAELTVITVTDFYFRNKEIYKFPQDKAARVMLHFEGTDYAFERQPSGDWAVVSPANKRWELQSDMQALLAALNPVKAVGIESTAPEVNPEGMGLAAPVLTAEAVVPATTRDTPDAHYGPLRVGQPAADNAHQRYATVEGKAEVYRVGQALIDDVREALKGIRDR
jgi:hypothetical protein